MATITPTVTRHGSRGTSVVWEQINHDDTGGTASVDPQHSSVVIEAVGTFAGGMSVALHGSLDGTNFAAMVDPAGNAVAFTAAGLKRVSGHALQYQAVRSSGSSSDVDVILWAQSPSRA